MQQSHQAIINTFLEDLFLRDPSKAILTLEASLKENISPYAEGMIRQASRHPGGSTVYYQKLYNIWVNLSRPSLKPNPTKRKVFLLTDFTVDNFPPLMNLLASTYGIDLEVELSQFDSIEQFALSGTSSPMDNCIIVLMMSPQWLQRYLGEGSLVSRKDLDKTKDIFLNLINGIKSKKPSHIMFGNIPGYTFSLPGGTLSVESLLGYNLALSEFNHWLGTITSPKLHLIDIAEAILLAGGRKALAQANYFRAGMVFDSKGTIAVCREIASALASICGKNHRALIVDWDNTLWGGEVAELGCHDVICGPDSPEGRGYFFLQKTIKQITEIGTLLAGVSRNSPAVEEVFKENKNMALTLDDFSTTHVSFDPKSMSIGAISRDLGFGEEYMVFMDDNIFELAEVFTRHPGIDLILAGPEPETTLKKLTESRLFNTVSIVKEDLERCNNSKILKKQRELKSSLKNIDEFLQAINISLTFSRLNEKNKNRAVQLIQKSNQFNLTTRRHGEDDLIRFGKEVGEVIVVAYDDTFGSQGIISIVILVPSGEKICIESWVMSCRVLNRTVEQAIFSYIQKLSNGRTISGEYIPTEKNKLVKSLYESLSFQLVSKDESTGAELWDFPAQITTPSHFVTIKEI